MSEAPLDLPRPLPGTLGSLRPPLLNLGLFVLTAASAFIAGALLTDTQLPPPTKAEAIRHGLAFSATLLAILLAHEMGHFLLARKHGLHFDRLGDRADVQLEVETGALRYVEPDALGGALKALGSHFHGVTPGA